MKHFRLIFLMTMGFVVQSVPVARPADIGDLSLSLQALHGKLLEVSGALGGEKKVPKKIEAKSAQDLLNQLYAPTNPEEDPLWAAYFAAKTLVDERKAKAEPTKRAVPTYVPPAKGPIVTPATTDTSATTGGGAPFDAPPM